MLESNQYKIQYRVMLSRYRGKTICPECKGSRLKKEASYVKVGEKPISELVLMPVTQLKTYFDELTLDEHDAAIAKRLLTEITNRIQFLLDVGLGYLTLNRLSNTLSGGESQRINLATSLGSSLVGSMYILDEPSIGLHPRDTHQLIQVLTQLRDLGNTVVVVEHERRFYHGFSLVIERVKRFPFGRQRKLKHKVFIGRLERVLRQRGCCNKIKAGKKKSPSFHPVF